MPNPQRAPRRLNQEPESVRWARKKAGLTQTELAERAGIGRTTVVEIEKGTRSATDENMLRLADALNCPVVLLERKRATEPPAATAADVDVPRMRDAERAEPVGVPGEEQPGQAPERLS